MEKTLEEHNIENDRLRDQCAAEHDRLEQDFDREMGEQVEKCKKEKHDDLEIVWLQRAAEEAVCAQHVKDLDLCQSDLTQNVTRYFTEHRVAEICDSFIVTINNKSDAIARLQRRLSRKGRMLTEDQEALGRCKQQIDVQRNESARQLIGSATKCRALHENQDVIVKGGSWTFR